MKIVFGIHAFHFSVRVSGMLGRSGLGDREGERKRWEAVSWVDFNVVDH